MIRSILLLRMPAIDALLAEVLVALVIVILATRVLTIETRVLTVLTRVPPLVRVGQTWPALHGRVLRDPGGGGVSRGAN